MSELTVPDIFEITPDELDQVYPVSQANQSRKPASYWQRCRENMINGQLSIFMARLHDEPAGYAILNRAPKYRLYAQLLIPEIQDLNVLQDFRRQGIGTRIIRACEEKAREEGFAKMGISFGLSKEYGAAQRLYIQSGYLPDGYGVTYDREPVPFGAFKPVDDELCLMLVKAL